jgi:hypothetical protein
MSTLTHVYVITNSFSKFHNTSPQNDLFFQFSDVSHSHSSFTEMTFSVYSYPVQQRRHFLDVVISG